MKNIVLILKNNITQTTILLTLVLLSVFIISVNIGKEQIKIWDESSAAKNAVEMLANKTYFIAYSDGKPDHHDVKPPLQLWLKVISYKIFGINEFAVRFPTIVSALGIILLLIFLAGKTKNKWISIAILYLIAITPGFIGYHVARHGDTDTLLMFFVTSYYVSFFMLLEKYPKYRIKWLFFLAFFITLATYTKSIAGLAPMAGFPIYFILYKKNLNLLKDYRLYLTIFSTLLGIVSYFIIREIIDPGFLKSVYRLHFLVIKEYPGIVKHPEFSFYFTYLKNHAFNPFLYWLPLCIVPLVWSKNSTTKRLLIFSLISAFSFGIGQSALVMKNEWYIAPIYIFLWVSLAISLVETFKLVLYRIKHKLIKTIIVTISTIGFSFYYGNSFEKVYKSNIMHNLPNIYSPEKPGYNLREVKKLHPEIKDITIATHHNLRQVKFYTKKYEYEDSSRFIFTRLVDDSHLNQYILISDQFQKKRLDSIFHYSAIERVAYGGLYYTDSLKVQD